jgi:hypothetical protein
MNRFEELVGRAVFKGDSSALDQLTRLGGLTEGPFEGAAKRFKAVAANEGISDEFIRRVVVMQLLKEDRFIPIFVYLERVLAGLGMSFYSPGGSIQRRVCVLLSELFGVSEPDEYSSKYLNSVAVRVGLDLLATEVIQRNRPSP